VEEISNRVLQWGSHLHKKRVEQRQYFPPSQKSYKMTSNSPYGPSNNKVNVTGKSTQRAQHSKSTTYITIHCSSPPPGKEPCLYCGKIHSGCTLRTHPDANTNEKISWKESVTGKNIIRLKGPGASLNIWQQRYNGVSDRMVSEWCNATNITKKFTSGVNFPIETRWCGIK